jgi:hypothetical protein
VLPVGTDIIVLSPSGMGPNTSRSHLLPGMLAAVLANGRAPSKHSHSPSGGSLWRIREIVPTGVRAWIARVLPDRWALEMAARLELRAVDWSETKAFMLPSDDAGYVRLNLRGRERDGVVALKRRTHFWMRSPPGSQPSATQMVFLQFERYFACQSSDFAVPLRFTCPTW